MKRSGRLCNQSVPKKKNNPKFNKALLIINCILFLCALVVGILYIHYQEPRTSIPMFLIAVVTVVNAWTAWRALKGRPL